MRKESAIAVMEALDFTQDFRYGLSEPRHDQMYFVHRTSNIQVEINLWHDEKSYSYDVRRGESSDPIRRGSLFPGWGLDISDCIRKR
jgi:hypothetical protein